jgi:hypothetical protein
MISRQGEEFGNTTSSTKEVLTTTYQSSAGFTHQWNKHIDMAVSIGLQVNAHQLYIQIAVEGRIFPFRKKVNPFLYMGFGGMFSREFGLFRLSWNWGSPHIISNDIHLELQYKEQRGDMIMFAARNPMQVPMHQKGIQTSISIIL